MTNPPVDLSAAERDRMVTLLKDFLVDQELRDRGRLHPGSLSGCRAEAERFVAMQRWPAPSEGRGAETGPGWLMTEDEAMKHVATSARSDEWYRAGNTINYWRSRADAAERERAADARLARAALTAAEAEREIAEQRAAMAEALCDGFDAERNRLTSQRDEAVTLAGEAVNAYAAVKVFDGKYDSTVSDFRARLAKLTKEGT